MHAIQHVLSTTNSEITVVFSDKHRDDEINYKMAKLIEGEIGYGAGIRRYVLVCGVVIPIKIQKSYNASPDMPKEAHSPHVERWLNGEISQTGEKIEYASVTESAFQLQPERLMPQPTGFASYPTGLMPLQVIEEILPQKNELIRKQMRGKIYPIYTGASKPNAIMK
ncbi:hypothetical protein [Legionella drancourtii]|nr:hypothetical protein [Legionella drancourtii]